MSAAEPLDVSRYANEAIARMLAVVGTSTAVDWRSVIEKGLAAAYQQRDAEGLVSMVQLVSHLLDGQGRFEDAIGELDHALAFARSSPDAAIILHGIKASALAAPARFKEAQASLAAGEAYLAQASPQARTRYFVFAKVVAWQSLADFDGVSTETLLADCVTHDLPRDRSFLLSWYIPFLASCGDRRTAHPWIRHIRIDAQASGSRWRESDAAAFEQWDDFLAEPEFRRGAPPADRANPMSVWRSEAVRLREACLHRNADAATAALESLATARTRLGTAQVGQVEDYRLACEAFEQVSDIEPGEPPQMVHLNNLGAVLARAEAVATAGSQHDAGTWAEALGQLLPESVLSSMEWPLATGRLRGLLQLRAGNVRAARTHLEDAVEWCQAIGFGTEEAIARVQLGELCATAELRVAERTWREHRRRGAESLRSRGYDPLPHTFAVAHSLTLSSRNRMAELLTRREVEVLALLAEGKTYRQAADELGIAQATVQTLAHRVYEKLGVSGRGAASAEARRLGIL